MINIFSTENQLNKSNLGAFLVWRKENFITFAPRFMQSLIR